jgi:triacylglycerol esterase/lipase EstA (alpha/beta hydrolase family)
VFFSTKIVLSQTHTSPFEPPEKSDTIFVVDDSSGLDTGCTFRSGGPLVFEIEVSRFVGAINSNGTLQDPDTLTENGIISETATLTLPVFDVDYDISDRPSLIELGVNPERDVIKFNGVEIKRAGTTEAFLIGKNNTWILNEFEVPIEIIKFPEKASLGNTTAPAKNIITIEIDQENIGNYIPEFGTSEFWCTAVDWAALSFQAMPPIVLIHGNSSNGEFWVRRGFTQILNEEKIPYDNTINLPTTTVVSNGATLKNVILAVARTMGVQNIQIIAHSKGGLDAREFLASYYSTLEKNKELKIHTFITLSTPHKGSVGADYIRAVQLTSEFKLENENERTDLAEFLSDGYTQDEFNANYNLTTSWVRQFNNQNCLPINIKYYSVGADADINNNGSLERNEYEEMLDEAEVPGWKRPFANGKMNTMYSAIGGFSSVTVRDTGNTTFFGTPIWEMVETPTITFLENDMMVTVGSAKYSFNFIIQFSKNHASVADQEVAREVKKRLIYAR